MQRRNQSMVESSVRGRTARTLAAAAGLAQVTDSHYYFRMALVARPKGRGSETTKLWFKVKYGQMGLGYSVGVGRGGGDDFI